jgi:hypothetical protein
MLYAVMSLIQPVLFSLKNPYTVLYTMQTTTMPMHGSHEFDPVVCMKGMPYGGLSR